MIQRCPNCGTWCETGKKGFWDRADKGFENAAVSGARIGSKIFGFFGGKSAEKAGAYVGGGTSGGTGIAYANALLEGAFGDKFQFECPNCGFKWSTDEEEEDQTAEFEHEQQVVELRDRFPSVLHGQRSEKQQYIKELRTMMASSENTEAQSAVLYDSLAAAYYSIEDRNSALQAVNSSLRLFEDDNTRILKGLIMGKGRNCQDTYTALQEMVHFKSPGRSESPYFSTEQIAEEFSLLQSSYAQSFLSIPQQQRKHLIICEELTYLPQSFRVLPMAEIPTDLKFPAGHPITDTLYVCHPYRPDFYIPYNSYDVEVLRDEINEFSWIMECLGAKHIDFHDSVDHEVQTSQENQRRIHGGGNYNDTYTAHASYESDNENDEYIRLHNELGRSKDFALAATPTVPRDLVWYPHRMDWQRECESRLAGRLLHSDFTISTATSETTTESERKKIEADMKILLFSGEGDVEKKNNFTLKKEHTRVWKVNVDFYPLGDYQKKEENVSQPLLQQQPVPTAFPPKKSWIIWVMGGIILILILTLLIVLL